ncbi:hypothetical protein H7J07_05550 [Mycobacterium koreense]|uniref:Uncharacterized protein n=1 Tax=Mycolicibacillus koreensis TaxID=1069220 RepID=A0A7I7SB05_9MYCO|nr:hypothetical protein [Mycolicibacillus koreensis]MCV7247689.1 hypothetical protein [Mycolicibacillus koreensis]OSC34775.1 hypothetical protein B8W67_05880 [Mycolicibacillus koreensis]BBY54074.1 hypothetical protein MKOR_13250 [Mycolicibacillus koreensis]
MTEVRVFTIGGVPLVELRGAVDEKTGADLAAKVMAAINHAHDGTTKAPLSLPSPRLLRGG